VPHFAGQVGATVLTVEDVGAAAVFRVRKAP
jgi:hypothetical protein